MTDEGVIDATGGRERWPVRDMSKRQIDFYRDGNQIITGCNCGWRAAQPHIDTDEAWLFFDAHRCVR